jgi:hypothetical protein
MDCLLHGCGGSSHSANATAANGARLSSIAITPAAETIPIGAGQRFKATDTYSDKNTQDLTASPIWNSSSTAVATIAAGGLAVRVAPGASTITATSGGNLREHNAECCYRARLANHHCSPTDPSMNIAASLQFMAAGVYSDGSSKILTSTADMDFVGYRCWNNFLGRIGDRRCAWFNDNHRDLGLRFWRHHPDRERAMREISGRAENDATSHCSVTPRQQGT